MKSPSIRWRLSLTTSVLAMAVAALLVVLFHIHSRDQLLAQLEGNLERKCDEIITVLSANGGELGVETFLRAETSYRHSPYEYFYQLLDESGHVVAKSDNHGPPRFASPRVIGHAANGPAVLIQTVPHPNDETKLVRARSERLPTSIELDGRRALTAQVAVTLEPLERTLRAGLIKALLYAAGGVMFLFGALWFAVGRSLWRVSAISKQAAKITSLNLKERLPVHGSGDELAELSVVLNQMLDGLHRSWAQMENFTSDAAHQMRTPLTRIRGELDVMLQNAVLLSNDERAQLEAVRDELERLTRTCGRLLLLARLDRGELEQELLCDQIDLSETAAELVDQIVPLANEKGVRVECSAAPRSEIRCSKPLVAEALLNLLHNAVRFTPAGGRVDVSVQRHSDSTVVVVSDTGPGIPPELHETIFQRFFRTRSNDREGEEGSGLGLSIVRGIARAHGGDVRVESVVSAGSRFVLTLPDRH